MDDRIRARRHAADVSPGTSSRRSPCQPTVTNASSGAAAAHASGSSAATGESSQPWLVRQASGTTSTGSGSEASWATWRRPRAARCSRTPDRDPAARAEARPPPPATGRARGPSAASASTPMTARVGSPSRATVRALYDTPPPSRQPRGSSSSMSRLAAPTTRTAGSRRAGRVGHRRSRGRQGPTVYLRSIRSPFRDRSRRVFLRASRR